MRVVLRADATASGGVGHVIRTVALVEAIHARGDEAVLVGDVEVPVAQRACRATRVEVIPPGPAHGLDDEGAQSLARLARELAADLLHVDHYGVTPRMQAAARSYGLPLSTMADGAYGLRPADLTVDPTFGAVGDGVGRLGGVWYAPVRRRVLSARRARERWTGGTPADVLVVMGGTDPAAATPAVVELLAGLDGIGRVRVVVTGGRRADIVAAGRGLDLRVTGPVADLMRLATRYAFAVSASGTTTIELACVGVPMALVPVVANQQAGYDRLVAAGIAVGLGPMADLGSGAAVARLRRLATDASLRGELTARSREVVDGRGAERIVRAWYSLTGPLTARPARGDDGPLLLRWRNDPATRSASRSTGPVSADEHRAWLARTLADDDRWLLIVESAGAPVATVRFDRLAPGTWEVSVTVGPEHRGKGLAARTVEAGQRWLEGHADVEEMVAVHRDDNDASRRLFASLGYVPDDVPVEPGFRRLVRRGPTSTAFPGSRPA